MDSNIGILRNKIASYCETGAPFDLRKALQYYVVDVLGELAFSQSFGAQEASDDEHVPPVIEHSLLAAVTGAWPAMTFKLKKWLPLVPIRSLQRLFQGRQACADLAAKCVAKRLQELEKVSGNEDADPSKRKDLLTSLILARDPDTGEKLTQIDLQTEAFGFMYCSLSCQFHCAF